MIKYLIVDDEHIAHDIIKQYADLLPNLQLMKHCYDAIEALEYLNAHNVDLIFLDLNMPKLKGFEFLRSLSAPPQIIVTTAYKEHALESYELNVADYLLKPFSFERFLKAVNKVIHSDTNTAKHEKSPNHIFLRCDKKYIQIDTSTISYMEASGNYTKIITADETITVRKKISDLLFIFKCPDLIQVHKSFVVSKKSIKSIEGNRIFMDDHTIPIGRTYKLQVIQLLK